jgi:pimeloyl-ACP methyl ester carboxylesterase
LLTPWDETSQSTSSNGVAGAGAALGAGITASRRSCKISTDAVQAATSASAVFGHSYGELIALEAARRSTTFAAVAVYEPGVSVDGSIRLDWIPRYRELLDAGDARGAFAAMVRQSGAAPAPVRILPLWGLRLILRLAISQHRWQEILPLLEGNLAEHEQIARLDEGDVDRYSAINARVLLLGGQKSPAFVSGELFEALLRVIPDADAEVISELDHQAPDETAPDVIARRVQRFLSTTHGPNDAAKAVA